MPPLWSVTRHLCAYLPYPQTGTLLPPTPKSGASPQNVKALFRPLPSPRPRPQPQRVFLGGWLLNGNLLLP